jgi:hypothetical protein
MASLKASIRLLRRPGHILCRQLEGALLPGAGYTAKLQMILEFMERERDPVTINMRENRSPINASNSRLWCACRRWPQWLPSMTGFLGLTCLVRRHPSFSSLSI